jgi:hypothetical protein
LVEANAENTNLVYGRLEGANYTPLSGVTVTWKKGRSIYDLFVPVNKRLDPITTGQEITGENGTFTIGPFVTAPSEKAGYWFMSVEATHNGNTVGDIVFWCEYAAPVNSAENFNSLPQQLLQYLHAPREYPDYTSGPKFPVNYDESATQASDQVVTINWKPPKWFSFSKYSQYQMGLLGSTRGRIDFNSLDNMHKISKDV